MAIRRPDYPGTQFQPTAQAARVAGLGRWEMVLSACLFSAQIKGHHKCGLFQEQECAGNRLREHTQVFCNVGILTLNLASIAIDRSTRWFTKDIITPIFPARGTEIKRLVMEQPGDKPEQKPGSRRHHNLHAPSCTTLLQAGLSGTALEKPEEAPEGRYRDIRAARLHLHPT